jgi:hypothetical protein
MGGSIDSPNAQFWDQSDTVYGFITPENLYIISIAVISSKYLRRGVNLRAIVG